MQQRPRLSCMRRPSSILTTVCDCPHYSPCRHFSRISIKPPWTRHLRWEHRGLSLLLLTITDGPGQAGPTPPFPPCLFCVVLNFFFGLVMLCLCLCLSVLLDVICVSFGVGVGVGVGLRCLCLWCLCLWRVCLWCVCLGCLVY